MRLYRALRYGVIIACHVVHLLAAGVTQSVRRLGKQGFDFDQDYCASSRRGGERRARVSIVSVYWISFSDPERPVGAKFLGVVIVEAANEAEALAQAASAGLNPGGEPTFEELSDPLPPRDWFNRLLNGKESRDANRAMCKLRQAEDDDDY
ncbi:MAG: hypothetical protein ACLP8A_08755 [Methylovirgula sp.]